MLRTIRSGREKRLITTRPERIAPNKRNAAKYLYCYIVATAERVPRPLLFETPQVKYLSGEKNPIAKHSGITIRDSIFLFLSLVPSGNACSLNMYSKNQVEINTISKKHKNLTNPTRIISETEEFHRRHNE